MNTPREFDLPAALSLVLALRTMGVLENPRRTVEAAALRILDGDARHGLRALRWAGYGVSAAIRAYNHDQISEEACIPVALDLLASVLTTAGDFSDYEEIEEDGRVAMARTFHALSARGNA